MRFHSGGEEEARDDEQRHPDGAEDGVELPAEVRELRSHGAAWVGLPARHPFERRQQVAEAEDGQSQQDRPDGRGPPAGPQ